MDFGSTIKAAREARGISTSQLAAQTKILVQIIEGMERNDFKKIPAPIYGRGFVKLICECLDLDPVTMVPAFMSAYNGEPQIPDDPEPAGGGFRYAAPENEPPQPAAPLFQTYEQPAAPQQEEPVAEQETPSADQPDAPSIPDMPQPSSEEPTPGVAPADGDSSTQPQNAAIDSSLKGLELFDPTAVAPSQSSATPPPSPQPAVSDGFSRFAAPSKGDKDFSRFALPSAEDDFSRFASPTPEDDTPSVSAFDRFRATFSAVSSGVLGRMKTIRRPTMRIAILVVGALLVLSLCTWGIIALFRATSNSDDNGSKQQTAPAAEATQTKETNTAKSPDKGTSEPASEASTTPTRSTIPLKLPGFYID